MSTKADERRWIAQHLYEESRVERIVEKRATYEECPMWHELDDTERIHWSRRAARLQDWLATCRRLSRTLDS